MLNEFRQFQLIQQKIAAVLLILFSFGSFVFWIGKRTNKPDRFDSSRKQHPYPRYLEVSMPAGYAFMFVQTLNTRSTAQQPPNLHYHNLFVGGIDDDSSSQYPRISQCIYTRAPQNILVMESKRLLGRKSSTNCLKTGLVVSAAKSGSASSFFTSSNPASTAACSSVQHVDWGSLNHRISAPKDDD